MAQLAQTPTPPYYAVIFSSTLTEHTEGYGQMADKMVALAQTMPGYLGIDSAREEIGVTVSYWRDHESIRNWKQQSEHLEAQALGHKQWYQSFFTRIAKVERAYSFERTETAEE
jgi:heme-degrading monooxygenase HmoA